MNLIVKKFDELTPYELYKILQARVAVFVVEQNCPYQELDGKDINAYHMWLEDNGEIKACLRILDKGISYEEASVGRVITTERGKGYGEKILRAGVEFAQKTYHADKIKIGAQLYAKKFYEKVGFRQISDTYLEDGIMHIHMLLELA